MRKDEAIERVRIVRCRISAEYGDDPKRLLAHYRQQEAQYKDRILKGGKAKSP